MPPPRVKSMEGGHHIKVIVVGEPGVGKTSLVRRASSDMYTENYKATIGVDFAIVNLDLNDVLFRLQLWDIGGQERFGNMTRIYFRDAKAAIVVCSAVNTATCKKVGVWMEDIRNSLGHDIPMYVIANKEDLMFSPSAREAMNIEMVKFQKEFKFVKWSYASAKQSRDGIMDAIRFLATAVDVSSDYHCEEPLKLEEPKRENKKCC